MNISNNFRSVFLCIFTAGLLYSASVSAATPAPEFPGLGPEEQPTEISSVKLEMWTTDTETRAIFTESVLVTGNNIRITCDRMEVVAHSIAEKDSTLGTMEKFKSLVATGNVHIIQGDREVTCGRADVFPGEDRLVLTEDPVVIDKTGPYISTGNRIILLRGERRILGDNVRTILPPIKDLGADAKKHKNDNESASTSARPRPVQVRPSVLPANNP